MFLKERNAGILMPIFSLPSCYEMGSFGQSAFDFVDWLTAANQRYWQVLPHGVTGFGNSPYQCFSVFAGNPYFIDLAFLERDGLLTKQERKHYPLSANREWVDYGGLYEKRYRILKSAFYRFTSTNQEEYNQFKKQNAHWLKTYGLFMALKNHFGQKPWYQWPMPFKVFSDLKESDISSTVKKDIGFHQFVQYLFYRQWQDLKSYATSRNVQIIGDLPIYVALDSVEVWTNPKLFDLDAEGCPKRVAGCPPDGFSDLGQLWGNPLYNWDNHKKQGYEWWISRMQCLMQQYDGLRIDHFRGFESYYAIDGKSLNGAGGQWLQGPGISLFQAMEQKLGRLPIIAEDLGYITPQVRELLAQTQYPGMKVLQFAFDGNAQNEYLRENHIENCVVYTGTHDNPTSKSWYHTLPQKTKKYVSEKVGFHLQQWDKSIFLTYALSSKSKLVIIPLQDYLDIGEEGRINYPSVLENNWRWRVKETYLNDQMAQWIANLMKENNRNL